MNTALAVLAALACAPAVALSAPKTGASTSTTPTILWNGDYQTGDFSQWSSLQALPGDATIVSTPTRRGGYTARYVVHPGDDPIGSNGERAEARASQAQTGGYAGTETWYGWSTYFPSDFNPPLSSWNIFTQWHETLADGCAPNIALQADTGKTPYRIKFRVRGGTLASGSCAPSTDRTWYPTNLALNVWSDFVLHVKWSSDPAVGFVELWLNGARVVPKTFTATLYTGQGAYMKQGFYRADSPLTGAMTSTVYHSDTRRGNTYAAVAP